VNDQERQIISDIFKRLEATAGQSRDAEAERFIADKVRQQPYAPYAMAQALYVQEEAMKSLNEQLEQLKAENEQLRQQGSGGFLSSIFGGGQRSAAGPLSGRQGPPPGYVPQQPQYAPQQGGPWGPGGGAPQAGPWGGQPGYAQPQAGGGGGFLRGALTTAAGVAGGMVVGNALMNAFSGHGHSTLGSLSQTDMASLGGLGNSGFDQGGFGNAGFDQGGLDQGAGLQDASFDPGGDFGGDMGGDAGGDDSSWT
jgi:hypothetical protein